MKPSDMLPIPLDQGSRVFQIMRAHSDTTMRGESMLPPPLIVATARRVLQRLAENSYPSRPDILRLRQWAAPRGMRPIKEIALAVVKADGRSHGDRSRDRLT